MNIYEKPEIQYIRFDALVPVMDATPTPTATADPYALNAATPGVSTNLFSGETAADDYTSYGSAAFNDDIWNQ